MSGNPKGRTPGTRNRATVEARELANRLLDDPAYRESLRQRLIDGTAGGMEALLWLYAYGRPAAQVEENAATELAALTNIELRARLVAALQALESAC